MLKRPTQITVRQETVRTELLWRVRFREAHSQKIAKRFFHDKKAAEKFAEQLRDQNRDAEGAWALLNANEKAGLMAVWREAQLRNVDLMAAVMDRAGRANIKDKTLGKTIAEMIVAKRNAGQDAGYLADLENILNRFALGRESRTVAAIEAGMIGNFLDSLPIDSRPTARSRISTLFNYCVRQGYRPDNPVRRLERPKVVKKLPGIMTPDEAAAAVAFLVKPTVHRNVPVKFQPHRGDGHEALAWFVLTAFAGLRPEEAMQLNRDALRVSLAATKPFVEVTPEITKTGQWRIVYPRPEVVAALNWALAHGSRLPLDPKRKRRAQVRLREVLHWAEWKQDITRRSASSYWLALTNDLKLMVEMMGNSEAIFKRHYKKPVPQEQAAAYFAALQAVPAPTAALGREANLKAQAA